MPRPTWGRMRKIRTKMKGGTHTWDRVEMRTHSAVTTSPARASSAIHCTSSWRRFLIVGRIEASGKDLGTIVRVKGTQNRACRVGTWMGLRRSLLAWRLRMNVHFISDERWIGDCLRFSAQDANKRHNVCCPNGFGQLFVVYLEMHQNEDAMTDFCYLQPWVGHQYEEHLGQETYGSALMIAEEVICSGLLHSTKERYSE